MTNSAIKNHNYIDGRFILSGNDSSNYLDIESELGLQRIAQNAEREVNRLDLEKLDMHQRVRQGYLRLAEQEKDRIVTIDASRDLDSVVEEVYQVILQHLA